MAYPSTFADIQAAVIANVRLNATNDTGKVSDWINQIYTQACVETEANQTSANMTLAANTNSYTIAVAIQRIKSMFVTPVGGYQSVPIEQVGIDEILRRRSGQSLSNSTGSITHYALLGLSELEVWPTPVGADTVTIYYVALPTALSANGDVPILPEPYASDVLIYGASMKAAEWKGDPMAQYYRQLFGEAMSRLRSDLTRKRGGVTGYFPVRGTLRSPVSDNSIDRR